MTDLIERELGLTAAREAVWARDRPAAGWLADEVELDLRPGGDAEFALDGRVRTGWVEEVTAPRRTRASGFWWAGGRRARVAASSCR